MSNYTHKTMRNRHFAKESCKPDEIKQTEDDVSTCEIENRAQGSPFKHGLYL